MVFASIKTLYKIKWWGVSVCLRFTWTKHCNESFLLRTCGLAAFQSMQREGES